MISALTRRKAFRLLIAAIAAFASPRAFAADAPNSADVGVVSHLSVVSDKVPDVSSIDAWRQSFIKPGMSEKDKAIAVWKSMVMFRHQANPPNDFCAHEGMPLDPIR